MLGSESRMNERKLSRGMRVLVGAFGAGVLALGLLLAAVELRWAYLGAPRVPTLLAAVACGLVAVGGGSLLRSAVRGRIALRRIRHRPVAK